MTSNNWPCNSAVAAAIFASSRAFTAICSVVQVAEVTWIAVTKSTIFSPFIAAKASGNRSVATQPTTKAVAPGVFFFSLFRGVAQFDSSAALNPNGLAGLLGCFLSFAQWVGLAVHGFSVIAPAQSFNHSS